MEVDDITVWSVKPEEQSGWRIKRGGFPKFEPVPFETGKAKKTAK